MLCLSLQDGAINLSVPKRSPPPLLIATHLVVPATCSSVHPQPNGAQHAPVFINRSTLPHSQARISSSVSSAVTIGQPQTTASYQARHAPVKQKSVSTVPHSNAAVENKPEPTTKTVGKLNSVSITHYDLNILQSRASEAVKTWRYPNEGDFVKGAGASCGTKPKPVSPTLNNNSNKNVNQQLQDNRVRIRTSAKRPTSGPHSTDNAEALIPPLKKARMQLAVTSSNDSQPLSVVQGVAYLPSNNPPEIQQMAPIRRVLYMPDGTGCSVAQQSPQLLTQQQTISRVAPQGLSFSVVSSPEERTEYIRHKNIGGRPVEIGVRPQSSKHLANALEDVAKKQAAIQEIDRLTTKMNETRKRKYRKTRKKNVKQWSSDELQQKRNQMFVDDKMKRRGNPPPQYVQIPPPSYPYPPAVTHVNMNHQLRTRPPAHQTVHNSPQLMQGRDGLLVRVPPPQLMKRPLEQGLNNNRPLVQNLQYTREPTEILSSNALRATHTSKAMPRQLQQPHSVLPHFVRAPSHLQQRPPNPSLLPQHIQAKTNHRDPASANSISQSNLMHKLSAANNQIVRHTLIGNNMTNIPQPGTRMVMINGALNHTLPPQNSVPPNQVSQPVLAQQETHVPRTAPRYQLRDFLQSEGRLKTTEMPPGDPTKIRAVLKLKEELMKITQPWAHPQIAADPVSILRQFPSEHQRRILQKCHPSLDLSSSTCSTVTDSISISKTVSNAKGNTSNVNNRLNKSPQTLQQGRAVVQGHKMVPNFPPQSVIRNETNYTNNNNGNRNADNLFHRNPKQLTMARPLSDVYEDDGKVIAETISSLPLDLSKKCSEEKESTFEQGSSSVSRVKLPSYDSDTPSLQLSEADDDDDWFQFDLKPRASMKTERIGVISFPAPALPCLSDRDATTVLKSYKEPPAVVKKHKESDYSDAGAEDSGKGESVDGSPLCEEIGEEEPQVESNLSDLRILTVQHLSDVSEEEEVDDDRTEDGQGSIAEDETSMSSDEESQSDQEDLVSKSNSSQALASFLHPTLLPTDDDQVDVKPVLTDGQIILNVIDNVVDMVSHLIESEDSSFNTIIQPPESHDLPHICTSPDASSLISAIRGDTDTEVTEEKTRVIHNNAVTVKDDSVTIRNNVITITGDNVITTRDQVTILPNDDATFSGASLRQSPILTESAQVYSVQNGSNDSGKLKIKLNNEFKCRVEMVDIFSTENSYECLRWWGR